MLIERIELTNYRQYRNGIIDFAIDSPEKNFTIIQGSNGSGKTNILNAITWCFYDKELHLLKDKYKGLPIYNLAAANQLKPEQTGYVEVKIHMRDDENGMMLFSRRIKFKKDEDTIQFIPYPNSNADDGSDFRMMRIINKDMKEVIEPEYILNMMIPQSIEEYFFFDGERLDDYFTELSGERIKEAVFNISQLGLLEKATKHLDDRKREFLKNAKDLSSKAKEIKERKEILEKSLEEFKVEKDKKVEQKIKAIEVIREYNEKLKSCSIKNVEELEQEREGITKSLEKLVIAQESLEKERLDYLVEDAPKILGWKAILRTMTLIDGRKEAGDIPPKYKKFFLDNLLKDGKCICGTDISESAIDSTCRLNIQKIQRDCAEITNISEELIQIHADIRSIIKDINSLPKSLKQFNDKHIQLNESIREKDARLKQISSEISGQNIDHIREWEHKIREYDGIKDRFIATIASDLMRIQAAEIEIRDLDMKLNRELMKEKKHEELRGILSFCEESLRAANSIKNGILDSLRKEIEEKTKSQFFNLIWKKETYIDVKIDENYDISVLHQSGKEGLGTLSAGERQVLALSFMAALNSVSGFNVPIIIDTPLGNISKEPKKNIAVNLPNYLKGKQVTMLVTEEEYSPEVRERLLARVGKEYKINFVDAIDGSEAKVVTYE